MTTGVSILTKHLDKVTVCGPRLFPAFCHPRFLRKRPQHPPVGQNAQHPSALAVHHQPHVLTLETSNFENSRFGSTELQDRQGQTAMTQCYPKGLLVEPCSQSHPSFHVAGRNLHMTFAQFDSWKKLGLEIPILEVRRHTSLQDGRNVSCPTPNIWHLVAVVTIFFHNGLWSSLKHLEFVKLVLAILKQKHVISIYSG